MNIKKKEEEGSEVSETLSSSSHTFPLSLQPTTSAAGNETETTKEEKPRDGDQSLLRDKRVRNALKEAAIGLYKEQKVRKERNQPF